MESLENVAGNLVLVLLLHWCGVRYRHSKHFKHIGGSIKFEYLQDLNSLGEFSSLISVGGDLYLDTNAKLFSLNAFPKLTL